MNASYHTYIVHGGGGGGGLVIKCYGSYTLLFQCKIGLRYF